MKKYLFAILFALIPFISFANDSQLFSNEISLGTGICIYGDSDLSGSLRKQLLKSDDFKRIIVGVSDTVDINISEPIKILFGADTFTDFIWDNSEYYNTFDYSFSTGIKIFPGIEGLNVGISYCLGNRTDFYKIKDQKNNTEKKVKTASWGNGYKISIQYDFMTNKDTKNKEDGTEFPCRFLFFKQRFYYTFT